MTITNSNMNETIRTLQTAYEKNKNNLFYLSALGIQYLERKSGDDESKAIELFKSVIQSEDESENTLRAKAVAYSRLGQYHRLLELYEEALSYLAQAKNEKYYNKVTDFEKDKINSEYTLVQRKLHPNDDLKESFLLMNLENNLNEKLYLQKIDVDEHVSLPAIDFYYQLLEFIEKDDNSIPQKSSFQNDKYWLAFANCRKALKLSVKGDENKEKIETLFSKAAEIFRNLKNPEGFTPSSIYYFLSLIYIFQNSLGEALFEINEAIQKNPNEVAYYKLRRHIYIELATQEKMEVYLKEAQNDEFTIKELEPYPENYQKILQEYNQINHLIEFYPQVKSDKNTYCDVLKHMLDLKLISLDEFNRSHLPEKLKESSFDVFKTLTEEDLVALFRRFEIIKPKPKHLDRPFPIFESIPAYFYDTLRTKLQMDLLPKRGETLLSKVKLHNQAAMLSSVLAVSNPNMIKKTKKHASWVIQNTHFKENIQCSWAQAHRIMALLYLRLGKKEKAKKYLNELLINYPEDMEIKELKNKFTES